MAANKIQKVFCQGVYLAENTSQAASVEFVPPAGGKLCAQQTAKTCRKAPKGFCDSLKKVPKQCFGTFLLSYFAFLTPEDFQACSARETAITP